MFFFDKLDPPVVQGFGVIFQSISQMIMMDGDTTESAQVVFIRKILQTLNQSNDRFRRRDVFWQLDSGMAQRIVEMVENEANVGNQVRLRRKA